MATQTLEGTWEELVAQHAADLAGHRVRVLVLDQPPDGGLEALSEEEFEAALDAFAEGSENLPNWPGETYSRETIYADHD